MRGSDTTSVRAANRVPPGYRFLVIADEQTSAAVRALIERTYAAMSTPASDVADLFGAADIAIAGSGAVTIWRRGDVAWAQILGSVHVTRDGVDEVVPYWTTGVFGLEGDLWRWLYWGGSEPQESPKV